MRFVYLRPGNYTRKATFLFLASLCFSATAFAFGAVTKGSFAEIEENQSAKFSLLLLGDNEEVEIFVSERDEDWTVVIDPETVSLEKNAGEEYVVADGTYKMASVVNIFVKPVGLESGSVVIGARSGKSGSGVLFSQEIQFRLSVVNKNVYGKEEAVQESTQPVSSEETVNVKASEEEKDISTTILFAVVLIVLASFLLYRLA